MTAITNAESFARYIHTQVTDKSMTYLDAVIDFCAERELEPESVVPFIDDKIKSELHREGIALHLLSKKTNALPLE